MKRASDVPPVVDNSGVRPVASAIAFATISVNGPGLVTNTFAFEYCHSNLNCTAFPAALRVRSSSSAFSESCVWQSLKRILKLARASLGMRLTVLLPTSTEVNSRCEGWKLALPRVERLRLQRFNEPHEPAD